MAVRVYSGGGGGSGGPHTHTIADAPPGSTFTIRKDPATGFWPANYNAVGSPVYTGGSASAGKRPTVRGDVTVVWKGPPPFPPIVASGDGGMRDGIDLTAEEPVL